MNFKNAKLITFAALVLFLTVSCSFSGKKIVSEKSELQTSDDTILNVKSYGFVDLEGAKTSAVIVEYNQEIEASSVDSKDYEIMDYAIFEEKQNGYDKAIERDNDGIKGNEGQITKVYVNDKPEISNTDGTSSGKFVIIEVNTDYMLSGQNLSYTSSMMAGVKQIGEVKGRNGIIKAGDKEFSNYTLKEEERTYNGKTTIKTVITADKDKIILPEFEEKNGWYLKHIGNGAFKAINSYSEYTGKYEEFELPYSIYIPNKEILEKNKGNISLVLHMEHAGANDTDPMAAITSSKAAVKLSGKTVQKDNPSIIVVPQIEESRRSTNDTYSSSEANTAIWELLDHLLKEYKGYINESRIYGTGQSMGGMTILNMAAQRDNFFAGIAVVGAQWGNNYNKNFQNDGALARTPQNDKISFNGFGLDRENFQNWYYMISDDNILIHTTSEDTMATGIWQAVYDYFEAAGVKIPRDKWDPYIPVAEQNEKDRALTSHNNTKPGSGISWGIFTRGNHMSTWKYGYQLDYPFEWLFTQRRETQKARGKITQLKNNWFGRDKNGNIVKGSGTNKLNSPQFTLKGVSDVYKEGWTPVSATNELINQVSKISDIKDSDKKLIEEARKAYNLLSSEEKRKVKGYNSLLEAEKKIGSLSDKTAE